MVRSVAGVMILVPMLAGSAAGQSRERLAPGDFIRFEVSQQLESRDATGRLTGTETVRIEREGTLISLARDTLVVEQDGVEARFTTERIHEVRVRRTLENATARGFRSGALRGGISLGLAGAGLALCNPSIFGDGGCTGADGAGMVIEFTLVAGGVGALTGGLLGALFAPRSEWDAVQLTASTNADGAVGLGFRVAAGR